MKFPEFACMLAPSGMECPREDGQMDLRLTTETARNAVVWILNCIGVVLFLWATANYGI